MAVKSLDTAAIEQASAQIRGINQRLTDTLSQSKTVITSLGSVWTGQASDETIAAFNAFETKYSVEYRQMLEAYTNFLSNVAAQGYSATEASVARKSDQI